MLLFMSVLPVSQHVQAQEVRDSVRIYFRQGRSELDMSVRNNRAALGRIADSLSTSYADSVYILRKILVEGGASPEGSIPLNRKLSEKRAETLFGYLAQYGELPDSLTTFRFIGRDWTGLLRLAEADEDLPYREQTLDFLRQVAENHNRANGLKTIMSENSHAWHTASHTATCIARFSPTCAPRAFTCGTGKCGIP